MFRRRFARSIFDLRPATQARLDDLASFVHLFGVGGLLHDKNPQRNQALVDLHVAQFIAIRACLRMPL